MRKKMEEQVEGEEWKNNGRRGGRKQRSERDSATKRQMEEVDMRNEGGRLRKTLSTLEYDEGMKRKKRWRDRDGQRGGKRKRKTGNEEFYEMGSRRRKTISEDPKENGLRRGYRKTCNWRFYYNF